MVHYIKQGRPNARAEDDGLAHQVRTLLDEVRSHGEHAVRRLSSGLDSWNPESFRLTEDQIASAVSATEPVLARHIDASATRVRRFAQAQLGTVNDLRVELEPGFVAGHRHIPVGSVGAYVAGGRYQLISSALMSVIPAKTAGVGRVVAMIGPRHGHGPSAATVYAAHLAGADEIWSVGGVQALAALAFGSLPGLTPVDLIVGAGNAYVAEAKRQLFGDVGIDLLAGPSELLIIADDGADPNLVAVDLLAQAEHGPTSPVTLVTTSEAFGRSVLRAMESPLDSWPTGSTARQAWDDYGTIAVVADMDEALRITDEFAAEHVSLLVDNPQFFIERLRNYGAIFVGEWSTVAFGDKSSGPNHTLPTRRAARYTGGLSALKFLKTVTYQEFDSQAAAIVAADTAAIADAEGMFGHAVSARMRLRV